MPPLLFRFSFSQLEYFIKLCLNHSDDSKFTKLQGKKISNWIFGRDTSTRIGKIMPKQPFLKQYTYWDSHCTHISCALELYGYPMLYLCPFFVCIYIYIYIYIFNVYIFIYIYIYIIEK